MRITFEKILIKIFKFHFIFLFFGVFTPTIHAENQRSDSTILLNEVIVGAYQVNSRVQQIPGSISVLGKDDINISDGNNFSSTLHTVPGIYMHSGTYGTSRIVIRGVGSRTPYNTNRIKSYLNDIPVTSSDGISTPEDLDLLSIDRMEIIKGPVSTLYGSGLGGNINIYTPFKKSNSAEALVQYGGYNTIKTVVSGNLATGNLGIFGNANHLQSEGYRENSHFRRTSFITSGKWTQPSYSLEYTLLLMSMDAGIPSSIGKSLYETNPQAAASNWKAIEGYKKYSKGIAGITFANNISFALTNRFTVFGKWIESYEKRPFNNLDDGTISYGFRDRLNFHTEKWDFAVGIEFVNDTYKWQLDKNETLFNKNFENRNQLNLFALSYFRPAAEWTFSLGGALNKVNYALTDQFSDNGDQSGSRSFPFIFSPRIGVNYSPSRQIAFFSSFGHGFSMPSPEETLLPEGDINKNIEPEQGFQTEAGVRLNLFNNKTQFETVFYHINLSNLLVTKRLAEDVFTGINAGKTRHMGLEMHLSQRILERNKFPGKLDLKSSLTISDNTFIEFTDNDILYNSKKLPGIPAFLSHTSMNWNPIKPLIFTSQFLFAGKQFMNDANTEEADGYFTMNSKISYKLRFPKIGSFNLFLGVNNLTNSHYASMISVNALSVGVNEPRYYYPGMPRHYFSGIRFHLN